MYNCNQCGHAPICKHLETECLEHAERCEHFDLHRSDLDNLIHIATSAEYDNIQLIAVARQNQAQVVGFAGPDDQVVFLFDEQGNIQSIRLQ